MPTRNHIKGEYAPMRQKTIKKILALSMVGTMAFAFASCANTSSQDEPSQSQPTQEVETTPTPTPSEEPAPSQDTTPMPNEDEPNVAIPSQEPTPSEDTTTNEPQEPITTQEPTQSQEPIQTQAPTTTTTPTPTTPPISTPIHTHSFKGGDCSTPSICDCGEIGSFGDHEWITLHIDEVGHYESSGTHKVSFIRCDCGYEINSDVPNWYETWESHLLKCGSFYMNWSKEVPNGDSKYIVDVPGYDKVYCYLCGAIQ